MNLRFTKICKVDVRFVIIGIGFFVPQEIGHLMVSSIQKKLRKRVMNILPINK